MEGFTWRKLGTVPILASTASLPLSLHKCHLTCYPLRQGICVEIEPWCSSSYRADFEVVKVRMVWPTSQLPIIAAFFFPNSPTPHIPTSPMWCTNHITSWGYYCGFLSRFPSSKCFRHHFSTIIHLNSFTSSPNTRLHPQYCDEDDWALLWWGFQNQILMRCVISKLAGSFWDSPDPKWAIYIFISTTDW